MDSLNQTVNGKALNDAINLMFGPELTAVLSKIYFAVDAAMKHGYELGKLDGQENLETACDASFDTGYQNGYDQGYGEAELISALDSVNDSESYDNGYLQGVSDARANPALADDTVQDIINVRAWDFYDQFDAG